MEESIIYGSYHKIPSKIELIDGLRESFAAFLKSLNLLRDEIEQWNMVFTESITNAINYGNNNDESKLVEIEWKIRNRSVILSISDEGSGPSYDKINTPTLPDDPYATGGRGLYLIKNFCDRWEHWEKSNGYEQIIYKNYPDTEEYALQNSELEQAVEELTICYESITAFYHLGDALIQSESLGNCINHAIQGMVHVVKLDLITIQLSDTIKSSLADEIKDISHFNPLSGDSDLQRKVLSNGQSFVWESSEELENYVEHQKYKAGCCEPIKVGSETLGSITAARLSNTPYLTAAELNTIKTFSDLIGIAIANAKNQISKTNEQRALREIEIAADLQNNLIPAKDLTESEHWRTVIRRLTALQVGGDYVEAYKSASGALYLIVIDVMGKGVSAAYFASMLRTTLHIIIEQDLELIDMIHSINKILCREVGKLTMFATCCIAKISPELDVVEFTNAGHCQILFIEDKKIKIEIEPSGPPLGLFDDSQYKVEKYPLINDNGIIMITDGLYEWEVEPETMWSWNEFVLFVRKNIKLDPVDLWNLLQKKIKSSIKEGDLGDDQTMLYWETK